MAMPVVVGTIPWTAGRSRNGASWPPHQAGDVLVIGAETPAETFPWTNAPAPPGTWAQIANSPVSTGAAGAADATRATGWWCRADSDAMGAIPGFTASPLPDHIGYAGVLVRGCVATGNPIVLTPTGAVVAVAAAGVSAPGGTTLDVNCLIIGIHAHGKDTTLNLFDPTAWAGANLANITQHINRSTGTQNGGGLAIVAGERAAAGAYGPLTGLLTAAAVQAGFTFALKGEPTAPPATPASNFNCGFECGIDEPGPASVPDRRHWVLSGGVKPVIQTAIARNNGRAARWQVTNDVGWLGNPMADPILVARFAYYFNAIPSADCEIFRADVLAGQNPQILFRLATQDIIAAVGGNITGATAVPVAIGTFLVISVQADVSTGTRTMKMTVNGVSKGTASLTNAASSLTGYRVGVSCSSPIIGDAVVDDFRAGTLASAYPMADRATAWVQPVSDGTHSYNATTDFKRNDLTDIPLAATDTYLDLLGLLPTAGDTRLTGSGAAAAEYLEWNLGGMPAATSVDCMEIIAVLRGATAVAHAQTLRLLSAANTLDLFAALSVPSVSPTRYSKHLVLDPGGGALTTALINAFRIRWPFRGSGTPEIAGLGAEVSYVPSSPPPPPPGSDERNPVHTYALAGTYTITQTVTDRNGLTSTISHPVTVA